MYKENPKTKESGIICCIPQTGLCPNNCEDCFFQSGRSYLEPLLENLPNIPDEKIIGNRLIRVNDGNDSNVDIDLVLQKTEHFPMKFYNTSIPHNFEKFKDPFVLTINPGLMTDDSFFELNKIPKNLMFVRFRINTWNLDLADMAIKHFTKKKVPVILTFMAYFTNDIPKKMEKSEDYIWRKRTSNSYHAITRKAFFNVMDRYKENKWVYSCGKIEGDLGDTHCRFCGNCLREYFATIERINK